MSSHSSRVRQIHTFAVDRLPFRAITTPEALRDLSEVYHFGRTAAEPGAGADQVELFDGRFVIRQEPVEITRLAIAPACITIDATTVTDKASEYATTFAQDFFRWIRRVGRLESDPALRPVRVEESTAPIA